MVGKVRVAKAIGILILYIGRIRFVINRLGKGKEITERKEKKSISYSSKFHLFND